MEEYYDGQGDDHDFIDFYAYDLVGNRLKKEHDADPGFTGITAPSDLLAAVPTPNFLNGVSDYATDYEYDQNDRLLWEQKDSVTTADDRYTVYGYGVGDAGTQQTSKTVHAGLSAAGTVKEQTDYSYNVQGRLSTVAIDSDVDLNPGVDSTSEYRYNDDGFRISEKVDGVETLFLVDGNNHTGYDQVLEAWNDLNTNGIQDAGDTLAKSYVLGHDVIAQWAAASALYYLLYDGHGSTRGLVDAMGLPLSGQVYAYDAYGNQLTGSGLTTAAAALTTLLYSGEQSDLVTGLQYLRARFYDPSTGRFNRLDPFSGNLDDPQSLHKYLYTHADPVNGVDPSGEFLGELFLGLAFVSVGSPVLFAGALFLSFLFFARNASSVLTPAGQFVPVDYAALEANYQSVRIARPHKSADEVFRDLTQLSQRDLYPAVALGDLAPGGTVTFDLYNGLFFYREWGQGNFDVKATKYNAQSRFVVVRTLAGHPLAGWRAWRVTPENNGDILVETFAVEHPATPVDVFKFGIGGRGLMEQTWISLLLDVLHLSGGGIRVGPDTHFEAIYPNVGDYLPLVE